MNNRTFFSPSHLSFIAKGVCLLTILTLSGCAAWTPSGNPGREANRDSRALGGGYCPGCNMPSRLSKIN